MDFSKDIEKQKTVMGYPSMTRHEYISHQQTIPSSYNISNSLHHPPSYTMPSYNYPDNNSYNVNYSRKYISLQDQIRDSTNGNSASFGRYITTMMLILVIGMIVFSLVIWAIFGADKPGFHVESLQVPTGLVITSTSMLGNWQVNVSMKNPNDDLDIKVNEGKVAILYETNVVAENNVEPFTLAAHSSVFLFYNLKTMPGTFLDKGILSQANQERNDGVLKFALQINMGFVYTFETESKRDRIRVYCNDVKVQFGHGPKDKGESIKTESIDCVVNSIWNI
ncbi:hypothetical protein RND71_002489 [Anisodus tanguticus]|uniref:Late embryogenesis abundant protein LEA-2 subgroup domain-containing protein n=1 Tax=Anisodus tanguticus TaxID=243964 RepID=A0AAE1T3T6_9SOLA|nr:hypothetical protein RND71_002489 [Anisodus tanguticus]